MNTTVKKQNNLLILKRTNMRNFIFSLMAFLLLSTVTFGQTTYKDWLSMTKKYTENVNRIIESERPSNIKLTEFKQKIAVGDIVLSKASTKAIESASEPLISYAKSFLSSNKLLNDFNDKELILIGGTIPPTLDLDNGVFEDQNNSITWSDVAFCAAEAVGINFVRALASEISGSALSWGVIRAGLRAVGPRFFGAVGVAIMVVDFSWCLAGR